MPFRPVTMRVCRVRKMRFVGNFLMKNGVFHEKKAKNFFSKLKISVAELIKLN